MHSSQKINCQTKYNSIIIIITLFFLTGPNILFGQHETSDRYLKSNTSCFYFDSLPVEWHEYNVFAIGEDHLTRKVDDIVIYKIFKLLNREFNTKKLIAEFPYSKSFLINEYLKTNSSSIFYGLNVVDDSFKDFYKNIKRFNDSLPENKKIRVEGVDVENWYDNVTKSLSILLPDSCLSVPKEIHYPIIYLRDSLIYSKWLLETYFNSKYYSDTSLYKKYLGSNYYEFNKIIENNNNSKIVWDCGYPKKRSCDKIREDFMYSNLCNVIDSNDKTILLNFGLDHCTLDSTDLLKDTPSLLSRFNSMTCFKNASVCSIYLFCDNIFTNHYFKKTFGNPSYRFIRKKCEPNKFYLIKLDGENSPFQDISKKYFQYIIYYRKK